MANRARIHQDGKEMGISDSSVELESSMTLLDGCIHDESDLVELKDEIGDSADFAAEDKPLDTRGKTSVSDASQKTCREYENRRLYLNSIGKIPLLNAQEEMELGRAALKGDMRARQKMIESNLKLVVKIAKRYQQKNITLLDLIDEGNLGLMRAVKKFDPERGFRFSTYASFWIKQSIDRALMNQTRTIRLPIHVLKQLSFYYKQSKTFDETFADEPQEGAKKRLILAEKTNKTVKEMQKMEALNDYALSLCTTNFCDSNQVALEAVADKNAFTPQQLLEQDVMRSRLQKSLLLLGEKQRDILCRRFGLLGHQPATLEDVGRAIGLTRERVRQIQTEALQKLAGMLKAEKIGLADLLPSD